MDVIDSYLAYVRSVRRYSDRTVSIYAGVLENYLKFVSRESDVNSDKEFADAFNLSEIRGYISFMLDEKSPKSAKTVNLHLSALSGFCKFMMQKGLLKSNPVKLAPKPRLEKRLPQFLRKDALQEYFDHSSHFLDGDAYMLFVEEWHTDSGKKFYEGLLSRVLISTLYSLGLRRAELISLSVGDVDFGRNVVKVRGKGDKMREIPLVVSLCEEILLYLKAVEVMCGRKRSLTEPLFVTYKGASLYPVYVDRSVKSALGTAKGVRGQKSPHVLRHSLATELMNEDASLNSIKELLGHSSLAATQVYTHSSIARLKDSYERAHPRAKNGGNYGD